MIRKLQVFDPGYCADLIEHYTAYEPARTRGQINSHIRNNSVTWIDWPDILDFVEYFPEHDWIANPVQLSRYLPGEYYHWHQDVISGRSSQRAYTLTITLQPAEGAHIEVEDKPYDLQAGEGIVFPSDLQHRATPPTSGTRYALTVWAMRRVTG